MQSWEGVVPSSCSYLAQSPGLGFTGYRWIRSSLPISAATCFRLQRDVESSVSPEVLSELPAAAAPLSGSPGPQPRGRLQLLCTATLQSFGCWSPVPFDEGPSGQPQRVRPLTFLKGSTVRCNLLDPLVCVPSQALLPGSLSILHTLPEATS